MGRKLVILILIAGAAYFLYQRYGRPASEEEMLVSHLRDRFAVLVNNFTSAAGRSGLIGMDTTYDSDSVVTQVLKLKAELAELRPKLTEERAIGRADALSEKIETFCRKNDIKRP